jgi:hypothetical protein
MKQIFETLRKSINIACLEKSDKPFLIAIENNGFTSEIVTSGSAYAVRYIKADDEGSRIVINYRSVDPSGPFQNLPDINKYDIALEVNGKTIEKNHYEYE